MEAIMDHKAVFDAFFSLLEEKGYAETSLIDVAKKAEIASGDLLTAFPSKISLLSAYAKHVDSVVFQSVEDDAVHETPKERLFDTMMLRYETMQPHKAGLKVINNVMRHDPFLSVSIGTIALRSMDHILTAANITADGVPGFVKANALLALHAKVLRTWFEDDTDDLSQTMAALDKTLGELETAKKRVDTICHQLPSTRFRSSHTSPATSKDNEDMYDEPAQG
jgi:ubiquinone biosynthesis protein COQ9